MGQRLCFSVLMPVYNAAVYLEKAVGSVLAQSFSDFELVLVDDGSTDGSSRICDELAARDSRVVVRHLLCNAGVAHARNICLNMARGRYLTFVDADDFIDCELLTKVYRVLHRYHPEVVKYGCVEEYYNRSGQIIGQKKLFLTNGVYQDAYEIRRKIIDMEQQPLFGYLWDTVYDTDFLRSLAIMFTEEFKVNEDFMFNLAVFGRVKRMVCMDCMDYHYAKRMNASLSTKDNQEYYSLHMIKIEGLLEKYRGWGMLDNVVERKIFWLYTRYVYSSICRKQAMDGKAASFLEMRNIYAAALFRQYCECNFAGESWKKRVLRIILVKQWMWTCYLLCIIINIVKKHWSVFFAKIKGLG